MLRNREILRYLLGRLLCEFLLCGLHQIHIVVTY
eukprot:COSAG05_NODE_17862_length_318_cov_0.703196_1_plen_33_part_01